MNKKKWIVQIIFIYATLLVSGCSEPQLQNDVKLNLRIVHSSDTGSKTLALLTARLLTINDSNVTVSEHHADSIFYMIASEKADIFLDANLPNRHQPMWEKYGNKLDISGQSLEQLRSGIVVPAYVFINNLSQLNHNRQSFDNLIFASEKYTDIEPQIRQMARKYAPDFEIVYLKDEQISEKLNGAIDNNEWIAVYMNKLDPVFNRNDLKFLTDPLGVFPQDGFFIINRLEFLDDYPIISSFLDKIEIECEKLCYFSSVLQEQGFSDESVNQLLNEHAHFFNNWIPDGW